jgi:UDP-3-O-[3-hydroxymyristoyl] glucosamine N-acyltransferase
LGPDVSIGAFAFVGAGASIGARTVVYPHAVIGPGARLGDDCVVHAHVSVRERVTIGHRVVLQDGAVIGSDGFGFVRREDGTHLKIPQHADVVIEDDVEIGANTTIDRPAVGETRIGAGTKIDNLVQIAHGVVVGRRGLIAAQAGVAGSTILEDDVVLAGQAGVTGHIRIGRGALVAAQAGVSKSVEPGELVSGFRGMPNRDWLKASAVFQHLPALRKRVADLEQRLGELEEKLAAWPHLQDR